MASETITFLSACLLGAVLGVIYDLFRISRIAVKTCNVIIFIEDIIFFVIVTLSSFIFIVMKNDGVLRGFLIIGELLGALAYFSTASILIMKAAKFIIKIVKAILKFLYKLLIQPFVKLFIWLYRKIKSLFVLLYTKIRTSKKPKNNEETENNAV
ncbi:spore cortex biosynthesis protein YabQ [Paludicola sp. MB14-C6]|uniref:spore cortex biosynthesis protein YabQ n=1 Tax=Paludihabitans sp. MB14-C6 TaxID=3070656 RepID=UPI0027DDAEB9|nr:spore cortex biosynthesis protein YabQ [Paludicola sp. MB14-C6]WMJ23661.1 spore cortex biosynthesis protein YabQ [Paludicola sp. MB14-C6]